MFSLGDLAEISAQWLTRKFGWLRLLWWIGGALVGCLALGLISTSLAKLVLLLCTLALIVLLIAYLTARSAQGYHNLRDSQRIINNFTTYLNNAAGPTAFDIERWIEEIHVGKNGDTTIKRWLTLRVGAVDLPHCWTANYPTAEMKSRDRKKVSIEARTWGPTPQDIGARYAVATTWLDKKQRIYILFDEPAPAGTQCYVFIRLNWPGFFEGIVAGQREIVDWTTHRTFGEVQSTLTIKSECRHSEIVVSAMNAASNKPNMTKDSDGVITITESYNSLPPGSHVGYIIDKAG
ncbi:hypothetical protein OHQ89_16195 [Streptomyces canus]|uniref:hypothetical protein n=1 Tax=Streptomyces canus TaxID=58343 RepID=UPI0030E12802